MLYRNYYGPANDDYVDLGVRFNDFEILEFKHMSPIVTEKIEENYIRHMAGIFGERYMKEGLKYLQDISSDKEYVFRKAITPNTLWEIFAKNLESSR